VSAADQRPHVLIVGGGFAGLGCARELAKYDGVRVTLLDRNNYHQFQPLLYQVATSQLTGTRVAYSFRALFHNHPNIDVKLVEVASIDPATCTITTTDGETRAGDAVVLAAGSQPNFFGTPGADRHSFPLYSLDDAERLRSRIIAVFEAADRDPSLLDRGALNFVVVGGGPTGVETAGALADMILQTMSVEYRNLAVSRARVHVIDLGHTLLAPFSDRAHDYVAKVLRGKGVQLHLEAKVTDVAPGRVTLADGTTIETRCVVWGGGITAPPVAAAAGLPQGPGGRIDVLPDLTVEGFPRVYAVGDVANIRDQDGDPLPQLGSVAQQSGVWAAKNLLADFAGGRRRSFHYRDKGLMAMIGRSGIGGGAAIAAMGKKRREVHGPIAFAAWLGVHAMLMPGVRTRVETFVDWLWAYLSKTRGPQVLNRPDAAQIDWSEDAATEPPPANARRSTVTTSD
jgi:NADH:ubiquinone reductase (H+-translocating)